MDTHRQTDERLRYGLNTNQPSRERLCLGVLSLDRSYSDIRPRRPEGGPDGGRDIEALWNGEKCFGAIGFQNNVSDSPDDKREVRKKFLTDVESARAADNKVKSFVFFCNVDQTPAEIDELKCVAANLGFTHVDIYWRERLRIALDGTEGLALRFQYLGINLSEAEQQAFFARFGKDLENIIHGRLDRIEQKLEDLDFARWKTGAIRSLNFEIQFKKWEEPSRSSPEHFRVAFLMQGVFTEKREKIIGARDDYLPRPDGTYLFGKKQFFWREQYGEIERSWIPKQSTAYGGLVTGIDFSLKWRPFSPMHALEFEDLSCNLYFTENLLSRIAHFRFMIDGYVFIDWTFERETIESCTTNETCRFWPDKLTEDEIRLKWLCSPFFHISFQRTPKRPG